MDDNKQNGAFTLIEFLTWARIGRTKAYEEIDAGRLKIRKLGRKTLILRTDAEAWLENLPSAVADPVPT